VSTLTPDWVEALRGLPEWAPLLDVDPAERLERGFGHTLREILQQPATWLDTAARVASEQERLHRLFLPIAAGGHVLLTGSGSSLYAGECAALGLQEALGVPVQAIPSGLLLTHASSVLPAGRPFVLISLARSGNSPESSAALDLVLETRPDARHLIVTCNAAGKLATGFHSNPAVSRLVLDERTNDQSLVMTSSFTNLVVAVARLGFEPAPGGAERELRPLTEAVRQGLGGRAGALARAARSTYGSAVFLGTGALQGAAREAALKMLEMSGGRVGSMAESFLGLRHGPMSAVHEDTLLVAFLSPNARSHAYEVDVLREVARKRLGGCRVLVGSDVPGDLVRPQDVAIQWSETGKLIEADAAVLGVVVGQVLAFFRCLQLGLRPDAPSPAGIISRVVGDFAIHR
jgi:tagatose-6-phosphate ketose/aldose isomerase